MSISLARRLTPLFCALAVLLAAPAARADRPATEAEMAVNLPGTWTGVFVNRQNDEYPMTYHIAVSGNEVSGKAEIPDSSSDKAPTFKGRIDGRRILWTTSSGFDYVMRMTTEGDGVYKLYGDVSGTNDGEAKLTRTGTKIGSGDPYKDAWDLMTRATAKRCDCFLEKYAPAEFTKAYALSKDGAYGARTKDGMSMEEAHEAALESCRKKPDYNPANPCVVFMENDKVVWKP